MRSLIAAILLLTISCGPELSDFSNSTIQYRVISLTDSNRRPLVDMQFKTLNDFITRTNAIPKAAQQNLVSYTYFDAILGKNLDKQALIASGYYGGGLSDAELGLVKTTTDLVLSAASAMDSNSLMVIFEDDIIFRVDLDASFRFALKQVPNDWDMLFLGCNQYSLVGDPNNTVRSPWYPENLSRQDGVKYPICPKQALIPVPGTPWLQVLSGCTTGGWAYSLRASSATKIADYINGMKPITQPIDEMYRRLFDREIKAYCLDPQLASLDYGLPSFLR